VGHVYGTWGRPPVLFSFMKRVAGERTFYVVIEDESDPLVNTVFPQFFSVSSFEQAAVPGPRREGPAALRRASFGDTAAKPVAGETRFVSTVEGWVLRVCARRTFDGSGDRATELVDSDS